MQRFLVDGFEHGFVKFMGVSQVFGVLPVLAVHAQERLPDPFLMHVSALEIQLPLLRYRLFLGSSLRLFLGYDKDTHSKSAYLRAMLFMSSSSYFCFLLSFFYASFSSFSR